MLSTVNVFTQTHTPNNLSDLYFLFTAGVAVSSRYAFGIEVIYNDFFGSAGAFLSCNGTESTLQECELGLLSDAEPFREIRGRPPPDFVGVICFGTLVYIDVKYNCWALTIGPVQHMIGTI